MQPTFPTIVIYMNFLHKSFKRNEFSSQVLLFENMLSPQIWGWRFTLIQMWSWILLFNDSVKCVLVIRRWKCVFLLRILYIILVVSTSQSLWYMRIEKFFNSNSSYFLFSYLLGAYTPRLFAVLGFDPICVPK